MNRIQVDSRKTDTDVLMHNVWQHKIDAQLRISGETADFRSGRIDVLAMKQSSIMKKREAETCNLCTWPFTGSQNVG